MWEACLELEVFIDGLELFYLSRMPRVLNNPPVNDCGSLVACRWLAMLSTRLSLANVLRLCLSFRRPCVVKLSLGLSAAMRLTVFIFMDWLWIDSDWISAAALVDRKSFCVLPNSLIDGIYPLNALSWRYLTVLLRGLLSACHRVLSSIEYLKQQEGTAWERCFWYPRRSRHVVEVIEVATSKLPEFIF